MSRLAATFVDTQLNAYHFFARWVHPLRRFKSYYQYNQRMPEYHKIMRTSGPNVLFTYHEVGTTQPRVLGSCLRCLSRPYPAGNRILHHRKPPFEHLFRSKVALKNGRQRMPVHQVEESERCNVHVQLHYIQIAPDASFASSPYEELLRQCNMVCIDFASSLRAFEVPCLELVLAVQKPDKIRIREIVPPGERDRKSTRL